jgi:hypothetical protein
MFRIQDNHLVELDADGDAVPSNLHLCVKDMMTNQIVAPGWVGFPLDPRSAYAVYVDGAVTHSLTCACELTEIINKRGDERVMHSGEKLPFREFEIEFTSSRARFLKGGKCVLPLGVHAVPEMPLNLDGSFQLRVGRTTFFIVDEVHLVEVVLKSGAWIVTPLS